MTRSPHTLSTLLLPLLILASCAAATPEQATARQPLVSPTPATPSPEPPAWAKTVNGVSTAYPNSRYIAQRGRGPDVITAQNNGVAQISRWISSQIETSQSSRLSITERGDETTETRQTGEAVFVSSQTSLFMVRYALDPWYNPAEGLWETVAYIDRDEAWTIYEPQVRQRADAFSKLYEAAETDGEPFRQFFQYPKAQSYAEQELDSYLNFAQVLHPRKAQAFDEIRALISSIPQRIEQSRINAGIFIDCPLDLDGITAAALTAAISAEGFPVTRNRNAANAVCTAMVDEGMQTLPAGTFYTPLVSIAISGKSGSPLFSCAIRAAERSGAVNPDLAKRRGYTALAGEIRKSFHGELIAYSGNS
ncbi:hypothetical protein FACS189491_02310 [Spirochaetia bacterium]|nr:hypothetical protein FACS189491_02310 [Spirochaetia bacterium]